MDRFHAGLAAVVSVFCIGLVSGAAGGLLLGATAVVMLQSLELLADNRLFMEQFHIMDTEHHFERKEFLQWESNNQVHDIRISIFAIIFGVCSSTLSLVAGIYIGLSTYSLVIKKKGEAAMGEALAMAGLVCLMGVTATGYILGFTLEMFLPISVSVSFLEWLIISVGILGLLPIMNLSLNDDMFVLQRGLIFTPAAELITYILSSLFKIRLNLAVVLTPIIFAVKAFEKLHSLKLTAVTVPVMLIISDVYYIAGWQIVSLQSPTSTNISSAVVEAIFVGVLASLLWTVTVGMSLFVSWERGGTFKICATAAASGAAVLGAIKMTLPVLPGPTIGALIGVAGAVGVSLSAAGAVADQYGQALDCYGFVGRLGVMLGAVVGAFLSSFAHSGLSGMFVALSAATILMELFLNSLYIPYHDFNP